jgi:hypothetical protein
MARGGKRSGAGRRPRVAKIAPAPVTTKSNAAELIDALNRAPDKRRKDSRELAGWRELWEAKDLRICLDVRKYLYDKRDGKPVQSINHIHDKPIDLNVTHSLGERMLSAMAKAEKRLSDMNGKKK